MALPHNDESHWSAGSTGSTGSAQQTEHADRPGPGNRGGPAGISRAGSAIPPGTVCFVGAGPGAADLITLRGARRLAQADVVLFDALTDPALREFAPQARWVNVGKRGFCNSTGQAQIDALLVREAQAGHRVVRLKGGDPSIFGRLEEELQALAGAGIECEVVPGVTAALAAAADAQKPLTRRGRGRSVSFTTAMTQEGRLLEGQPAQPHADTEVFYMAGRQLAALGRRLQAAGWAADTAACVVSRAGCVDSLSSQHRLSGLAEAALLHASRPTVVTVGAGALAVADLEHPAHHAAHHGAHHGADHAAHHPTQHGAQRKAAHQAEGQPQSQMLGKAIGPGPKARTLESASYASPPTALQHPLTTATP
jgi:uroporphyrin-III C-methyltransferase